MRPAHHAPIEKKIDIAFVKMQGIGNDFVMVDRLRLDIPDEALPGLAQAVCDRRFGIGADGLILAEKGQETPFAMRMLNPDGSESEMCGNGVRCLAVFLREQSHTDQNEIPVETGAGILTLQIEDDGQVRVDMGPARLTRDEIGMSGEPRQTFLDKPLPDTPNTASAVSMGNPHLVIFVPDLDAIDLYDDARPLETHPLFPNRTNVHFAQILNRQHVRMKTWERGAGATLACGTGASACGVAAAINGFTDSSLTVTLPGGDLHIEYSSKGRVFMTGPAKTVFAGNFRYDP